MRVSLPKMVAVLAYGSMWWGCKMGSLTTQKLVLKDEEAKFASIYSQMMARDDFLRRDIGLNFPDLREYVSEREFLALGFDLLSLDQSKRPPVGTKLTHNLAGRLLVRTAYKTSSGEYVVNLKGNAADPHNPRLNDVVRRFFYGGDVRKKRAQKYLTRGGNKLAKVALIFDFRKYPTVMASPVINTVEEFQNEREAHEAVKKESALGRLFKDSLRKSKFPDYLVSDAPIFSVVTNHRSGSWHVNRFLDYYAAGSTAPWVHRWENKVVKGAADRCRFIKEVLGGVFAIHRAGYLHADLKWENVFTHMRGEAFGASIADWDAAVTPQEITDGAPFSTTIVPPELLSYTPSPTNPLLGRFAIDIKKFRSESDMYALGVMFYQIVTGERTYYPFIRSKYREHYQRGPKVPIQDELRRFARFIYAKSQSLPRMYVASNSLEDVKNHAMAVFGEYALDDDEVMQPMVSFIRKLLSPNPHDRPNIGEALTFFNRKVAPQCVKAVDKLFRVK